MKNLARALSLVALISVAAFSAAVQAEQKIAVVNVQAVLANLPQVQTIEQEINQEFAEQIQEVQKLQDDGNFLVEKLQRE